MAKYQLYRIDTTKTGKETRRKAGTFVEKPAPEPTLGGRLLALENETGKPHVAEHLSD